MSVYVDVSIHLFYEHFRFSTSEKLQKRRPNIAKTFLHLAEVGKLAYGKKLNVTKAMETEE